MKNLQIYSLDFSPISFGIPLMSFGVEAGFPSPAEDYIEETLDINQLVVKHPAATFFVRVKGESMCDANIHSGDILIVDRSLEAVSGKIVVAVVNGEFTVKRLHICPEGIFLNPESSRYPSLNVTGMDFHIWGVVTYVIHKAQGR